MCLSPGEQPVEEGRIRGFWVILRIIYSKGGNVAELITKLKIFVASPGDVQEERDRLKTVIDELNPGIAGDKGLVLELVRWETHAWPTMGEDAQDMINLEIGPYDVFIGIMWKRFGTPTGRAGSGTEEEFNRAYALWEQYCRPQIMFYFNKTPFYPSSAPELEQMGKVLAFKKELAQKGGLYWEYEGADGFEREVRRHLTHIIRNWVEKAPDPLRGLSAQVHAPSDEQQIIASGERAVAVGRDVHGDVVTGTKYTTFDKRGQTVHGDQRNEVGERLEE